MVPANCQCTRQHHKALIPCQNTSQLIRHFVREDLHCAAGFFRNYSLSRVGNEGAGTDSTAIQSSALAVTCVCLGGAE